jgi:hypothetical protein
MKIFSDKKAERLFIKLYGSLSERKKKLLGRQVRKLAKKKVLTQEGEEFYLTTVDIKNI